MLFVNEKLNTFDRLAKYDAKCERLSVPVAYQKDRSLSYHQHHQTQLIRQVREEEKKHIHTHNNPSTPTQHYKK